MATTQNTIRKWLQNASPEHTHMIVVADTFDYSDYPVYVSKDESVKERADYFRNQSMSQVMEVYSFSHDIEAQLNEQRAFHYD